MGNNQSSPNKFVRHKGISERIREIGLIAQDPILMIALVFSVMFLVIFIFYPIFRTVLRGFLSDQGNPDFTQFARYFDGTILDKITVILKNMGLILQETVKYGRTYRSVLGDTIKMGLMTATSERSSASSLPMRQFVAMCLGKN